MIRRETYLWEVDRALERNPVVALIGSRQCGKTTLAREFLAMEDPRFFDLEDPVTGRLMENPMTALADLRGLVVIDEAQRRPGSSIRGRAATRWRSESKHARWPRALEWRSSSGKSREHKITHEITL